MVDARRARATATITCDDRRGPLALLAQPAAAPPAMRKARRLPRAHPFTDGFWGDDIKQATECDDVNYIDAWLNAGNSVNARHETRGRCTCEMPLIASAAYSGAERVVRLLIARGADVNAKAEGGLGALFNAVCSHSPTIVELLLEAGARDEPLPNGDCAEDYAEMIAAPVDVAPPHSKGDPTCLRLLQRYKHGGALSREQQIACEVARRKQNLENGFEAVPRFPKECAKLSKGVRARIHGLTICLLYTSPSPRDATLSRMPSSA